jgi:LacI family transcriptional regulator
MSPTIKDVASAAQTSIKTVSRVVNDETGVSPEVRARVSQVIDDLGYVPNISARRLKRGQAEALALVLPRVESPYAMRLMSCFLKEASAAGYSVLVIEGDPKLAGERQVIERAIRLRQVDGLVIAPPLAECPGLLAELNQRVFPYVAITPNEVECVAYSVEAMDREGTAEATRYLISLGHRRIAYLTCGPGYRFSRERLVGFRQEMIASGIPPQQQLVLEGDTTFASGYHLARDLIESSAAPSAILAGNDEMAVGVVNFLNSYGYNVPKDISVMGFDDLPIAQQVVPSLTTVCQPVDQIVQAAAQLLLRQMKAARTTEVPVTQHLRIPTRLVLRRTCARPGE